ncbi:MAG TPA: SRPBCC family protein [Mycobacteriales bacterium]|nr:SRPBCC family protein [Mycobacteriales bacterium]
MVDRATASITIDATRDEVLAVIADFDAYPQWAGGIKRAQILETGEDGRATLVAFGLDAGIIKDEYTLAYDWDESGVSWHLIEAKAQKHQEGSYRLATGAGGRTEVVYELEIETSMPIPGLIKRKAQGTIMDTALKGLKKRVER